MNQILRTILLCGLISLLLGACATPSASTCESRDWYELGRRDGAQGRPKTAFKKRITQCGELSIESVRVVYLNGRNAGLVEYCSPQNAFEMGRSGKDYEGVCPDEVEPNFIEAYQRGQRARRLEQANQVLDSQIDSLFEKLQKAGLQSFRKKSLETEISRLKQAKNKNKEQVDKLENRAIN